jgi:hypothetical protein
MDREGGVSLVRSISLTKGEKMVGTFPTLMIGMNAYGLNEAEIPGPMTGGIHS